MNLSLNKMLDALEKALCSPTKDAHQGEIYRDMLLWQQSIGKAPPTNIVSKASFDALCRLRKHKKDS